MNTNIDAHYEGKFKTTKAELLHFLDSVKIKENDWLLPNGQITHEPQKLLWDLSYDDFLSQFSRLFDRIPHTEKDPNVDSLDLDTITNCQKVKSKILQYIDGKAVMEITEPVLIDNKFIYFYDQTVDAFYKIRVKQQKGKGAGYADDMVTLNNEHKEILKVWLDYDDKICTVETVRFIVNKQRKKLDLDARNMKPGSIQGRMSELLRRGITTKNKPGSKWHILNVIVAEKALESGLFPVIVA